MLSGLRTLLMVLGFSVHNLFEGRRRAGGETEAHVADVCLHHRPQRGRHVLIGTELVISGLDLWRLMTYILMLSAVSPTGVLVAYSLNPSQPLVVGSMQGLAAGTLLYVVFFEVRISFDLITSSNTRTQ